MRTEYITDQQAETVEQAEEIAPWAAVIVERDGGWRAYESVHDAETAENQI